MNMLENFYHRTSDMAEYGSKRKNVGKQVPDLSISDVDLRTFISDTSPDSILIYCVIGEHDCTRYWRKVK